ncbi:hypothetical protein [Leucobacter luti]|uniref:hypothetical protein n=1 Tax=Leucobacter luti TaxID=340320 RepID=UPI00105E3D40|nr:hypothetical protein [Leucobacter luti]
MAYKASKLTTRTYAPECAPRVIEYLRIHDTDTEPEAQEALRGTVEALFIDATSGVNGCQP